MFGFSHRNITGFIIPFCSRQSAYSDVSLGCDTYSSACPIQLGTAQSVAQIRLLHVCVEASNTSPVSHDCNVESPPALSHVKYWLQSRGFGNVPCEVHMFPLEHATFTGAVLLHVLPTQYGRPGNLEPQVCLRTGSAAPRQVYEQSIKVMFWICIFDIEMGLSTHCVLQSPHIRP